MNVSVSTVSLSTILRLREIASGKGEVSPDEIREIAAALARIAEGQAQLAERESNRRRQDLFRSRAQ